MKRVVGLMLFCFGVGMTVMLLVPETFTTLDSTFKECSPSTNFEGRRIIRPAYKNVLEEVTYTPIGER